jgi:hypothetical protein
MTDPRITELLALAAAEGLPLPYAPETILALEDTGAIVNLHTGAIILSEAERPIRLRPTVVGEALAVVLMAESTVPR